MFIILIEWWWLETLTIKSCDWQQWTREAFLTQAWLLTVYDIIYVLFHIFTLHHINLDKNADWRMLHDTEIICDEFNDDYGKVTLQMDWYWRSTWLKINICEDWKMLTVDFYNSWYRKTGLVFLLAQGIGLEEIRCQSRNWLASAIYLTYEYLC